MGNFKIEKLKGSRTCHNPFILQRHRQIDLDLIAEVMLTIVKMDLSTSVTMI
jgi:hypothetical protein